MNCSLRDSYIDDRLPPADIAGFEEHLAACEDCTAELRSWQMTSDLLGEWSDQRVGPTFKSDASQRQADMILARHRERAGQRRRTVVSLGLAAAASFFLAFLLFGAPEPTRVSFQPEVIYREGASSELNENVLSVLGRGRLLARIGEDRIGLGDEATVRILGAKAGEIQLRLEQGSLGVEAAKRSESNRLLVQVGQYTVRVLGTRFRVRRPGNGGLQVAVDEGVVEVTAPGQRWWIDAGKSLDVEAGGRAQLSEREDDDAELERLLSPMSVAQSGAVGLVRPIEPEPSASGAATEPMTNPGPAVRPAVLAAVPPAAPSGPTLERDEPDFVALRTQLARGQAGEVAAALEDYLQRSPKSQVAWNLLATARRKSGDLPGAVAAYRQVVDLGSVVEAAKARYEAARLLQRVPGGHGDAVVFFEALLAEPSSLRGLQPEIRLHLSRSLREMGRAGEADVLLQELVARWPATAAADLARGELSAETH